jgi:hypothetical protein
MNNKLSTDDFDYELPTSLIAHQPTQSRDASRPSGDVAGIRSIA